MEFTDEQLLAVARKYNLISGSLKSKVFSLLEQGYTLREIRFLLRDYRDPQSPQTFSNSLRRYAATWKELQSFSGKNNCPHGASTRSTARARGGA
ncbi:hypothetical protein hamaS1_10230 [Moorella sp. Hama-1]|nr:hypothetical protein hamaS1_10230 [Moorella sp. Hama-1]